jgi:alkylation response protein AidB-like acyl-CoA dehydrogenase
VLNELQPISEPGRRFVALAEEHAADFATRAAQHDRDGTFPHENFDAMKQSGFLAAPVPAELGGLGLFSMHDMAVGISRLARGDGSTSIAVYMHLFSVSIMHRMLRSVQSGGSGPPAPALEGLLRGVAGGQIVASITGTEAGTTIRYPRTEVTPSGDGTYLLNGHKIFGTLSPYATMFFVGSRLADGDGGYESVFCAVPRNAAGVDVRDNWDALGMRASGSGDVVYTNVRLPAASVIRSRRPLGAESTVNDPGANLGLIAAFLGIAEAAAATVVDAAKSRRRGPTDRLLAERHTTQHLIGELEVDLQVCRAMIARNGLAFDDALARHPGGAPPEVQEDLERRHQATKYVVNRRAIDAVDRALTASGGAGYMSKHPLSRLYRDVRAGPFMQPYAPMEALETIGRTVLGQPPSDEL